MSDWHQYTEVSQPLASPPSTFQMFCFAFALICFDLLLFCFCLFWQQKLKDGGAIHLKKKNTSVSHTPRKFCSYKGRLCLNSTSKLTQSDVVTLGSITLASGTSEEPRSHTWLDRSFNPDFLLLPTYKCKNLEYSVSRWCNVRMVFQTDPQLLTQKQKTPHFTSPVYISKFLTWFTITLRGQKPKTKAFNKLIKCFWKIAIPM